MESITGSLAGYGAGTVIGNLVDMAFEPHTDDSPWGMVLFDVVTETCLLGMLFVELGNRLPLDTEEAQLAASFLMTVSLILAAHNLNVNTKKLMVWLKDKICSLVERKKSVATK